MIKVSDPIYGAFQLPAVFKSLLDSKTLQRLSGVHHSGGIFLVNPGLSHSRLEHSIGVMLLLKQLGANELEQIAGLLHDISHTAFSHVGDYVLDYKGEDYHEHIFKSVLLNSDLPSILEQYGYTADQVLTGNFQMLEQPLPHLCADRLDYTLRDACHAGLITRKAAKEFLSHILVREGKISLDHRERAEWINDIFDRLNKEVYNHPLYVYANQHLAQIIRDFLQKGLISQADLLKDDTFLLNKIRSTTHGYEAIKAIKQHKGYPEFLKKGPALKIKPRRLEATA